MLTHIQNVKWVGALSLEDADVLAAKSTSLMKILEFGPGGSTMIFAQCMSRDGSIISVETKANWVDLVTNRLDLIQQDKAFVKFFLYKEFFGVKTSGKQYDMIFVDGEKKFREEFAIKTWPLLKVGGEMLFHDTKRDEYINFVLPLVRKKLLEIDSIQLNVPASNGLSSNISVVKKLKTLSTANDFQSPEQHRETWTFGDYNKHGYTLDKGLFEYKPN